MKIVTFRLTPLVSPPPNTKFVLDKTYDALTFFSSLHRQIQRRCLKKGIDNVTGI